MCELKHNALLNPVISINSSTTEEKTSEFQVHTSFISLGFYQILIRLQELMMVSRRQEVNRRHLEEVIDHRCA